MNIGKEYKNIARKFDRGLTKSQLRIRRHFGYHGDSKTRRGTHFIQPLYYMEPLCPMSGVTAFLDCGRPAPRTVDFSH